jgi:hypothetical protein
MMPKAELLSLPEELQLYILSFLPCQDILRCATVSDYPITNRYWLS